MEEIAQVYARALFEVAKERDALDEIREQLNQFADALNENRDLPVLTDRIGELHPGLAAWSGDLKGGLEARPQQLEGGLEHRHWFDRRRPSGALRRIASRQSTGLRQSRKEQP